MKRSIKILSILAMAGLLVSSCSKMNEMPKFNDKDAFVAFNSASMSFNENVGVANIPVTLVSLNGFSTSASFKVIDGTAKSGVHFNVTSSTLNFTPNDPVQNLQVQIVNQSGLFTGDLAFSIELENAGSVNLGASKRVNITILDLDHPLTPILGTYSATGDSDFDGPTDWTITLAKDATDVSKVWISNFVAYGSSASTPIYGIVNDDMTEIHIPIFQVIAVSSSYPLIRLEGYYGPDDEEYIEGGGYVTISIADDKKSMTIMDCIISAVYADTGATNYLGEYNWIWSGTIMTKN